jgi:hypothetical protein
LGVSAATVKALATAEGRPGAPTVTTQMISPAACKEVLVNANATIRDAMTQTTAGNDLWVLSASTIDISFAITQTRTISLGANGEPANELTHTPAPRTGAGAYLRAPPCQSADPALRASATEPATCCLARQDLGQGVLTAKLSLMAKDNRDPPEIIAHGLALSV